MDIEWAELELLASREENMRDRIKVLCMEYHLFSPDDKSKLQKAQKKLAQHYKNIFTKKSQYTENIGYVWCFG